METDFLWDPRQWSEEVAEALAREAGQTEMNKTQWMILRFLREYYFENGRAPLNRQIKQGTGISLMEMEALFPGALSTAPAGWPVCRIRKTATERPWQIFRGERLIYLDNAATTFPKPREVLDEMIDVYSSLGVSPGRGSYDLAMEAEERVMAIRRQICRFFGGSDPERVIFSYNATDALNTLIQGLITPGSHVVTSRLEHNSVLRPLHHFSEQGIIHLDLIPFDADGFLDPMTVAGRSSRTQALSSLRTPPMFWGRFSPWSGSGRSAASAVSLFFWM